MGKLTWRKILTPTEKPEAHYASYPYDIWGDVWLEGKVWRINKYGAIWKSGFKTLKEAKAKAEEDIKKDVR
jgi:hypothetical protein